MMEELEKAGKLDNTLIVLSADHYPYYLKDDMFKELNNGTNYNYRVEWAPSPAGPWCGFRTKVTNRFGNKLPVISVESYHAFRLKVTIFEG